MNDLISRQAAIDALGEDPRIRLPFVDEWADEYFLGLIRQYNNDKDAIMSVPTIEPKRGKWIAKSLSIKDVPTEACSVCGEWSYGDDMAYCPNCGARMVNDAEEIL